MHNFVNNTPQKDIDQIVYGDLLFDDKEKITCADPIIGYFFATGLINKFFNLKPPKNSSQQTINELLFLERVTSNASKDEILFATNSEINETKMYADFCKNILQLNFNSEFFKKIFKQTDPILMLLKNHHNRPRPYQLAPYYGIQLKFKVPTECLHAAYPSGHAFDAFLIANILKSFKPDFSIQIEKFCSDMANSRFVAGVHFPSDNMASKLLAETILQHNLIKVPSIS